MPTVIGGPRLSITAPGVTFAGNTYTIAAINSSTLTFTVEGADFDLSSPTKGTGNVMQPPYPGVFCSTTMPDFDYAGVYASAGALDTSSTDSWRPSNSPAPPSGYRQAGTTYWANSHGAVKSAGCSTVIPDQTTISDFFLSGTLSQPYTVNVCRAGSDYRITGARQGPSGPIPYAIDLGPTANLHVYTVGAMGTTAMSDTLEQATNVTFTGITAAC